MIAKTILAKTLAVKTLLVGALLLIGLGFRIMVPPKFISTNELDLNCPMQPAPTLAKGAITNGPLQIWAVNAMTRVSRQEAAGGETAISISAARNEYEPFQVVVSARGAQLTKVNASMTNFIGNAGIISNSSFLYREHYVQVKTSSPLSPCPREWYPDALIPFRHPYTGAELQGAVYDAVPFNLSNGFNQPLWVDVYVPKNSSPGIYTATLTVTATNNLTAVLPVILTVWNFTLPDRPYQRSSFGIDMRTLQEVYNFDSNQQPGLYYVLLRRYNEYLISHRLMAPPLAGTDPELNLATGQVKFDTGPYPGINMNPAQSLDYYLNKLQVNALWLPMSTNKPYPNALTTQRSQAKKYLGTFGKYFTAHNWGDRPYVYTIDEPETQAQYQAVRDWGKLIHDANRQYGTSIKFLVTEQPAPENPAWGNLYGSVDIWVPCCDRVWQDMESSNGTHTLAQRLALGEEVWWYTALAQPSEEWLNEYDWPATLVENYAPVWLLDYPPLNFRIPSWLNQHYGFTGLLYWQITYWSASSDVWQDPLTYFTDGQGYNGEGSLLYPAKVSTVGFDGPIASMRLKWLREGMEDYDYIQMLRKLGKRSYALSQVHKVARNMGDWDLDAALLYSARQNMGLRLHAFHKTSVYLPIIEKSSSP